MSSLEEKLRPNLGDALAPMQSGPLPDGSSWINGFGQSVVGNFQEFWGFPKTTEQIRWEAQNPGSAFFAGALGYGANLVGGELAGAKLIERSPALGRFVSGLVDAKKAPVMAGVVTDIAKIAPVEAGRIASSLAIGQQNPEEPVLGAALDIATTGLLSGGLRGLSQYGKRRQTLSDLVPGASPDLPPQLQMRAAQEYLKSATDPEIKSTVQNRISEFQKAVRLEDTGPGMRYVDSLSGSDGKDINRLFRAGSDDNMTRQKFIAGGDGFADSVEGSKVTKSAFSKINEVWDQTGFGPLKDNLSYIQYPRFVQAATNKGAGMVEGAVTRNLQNVGDGLFIGREANDGLFVVAKKLPKAEGQPGWVLFKTDSPGNFAPHAEDFAGKMAERAAWLAKVEGAQPPIGAKIYDFANSITQRFPLVNYLGLREGKGAVGELASMIGKKTGLDKVAGSAGQTLGDFFNRYFTVGAHQFGKSPRANWLNAMSRAVFEEADKQAQLRMFGDHVLNPNKSLWASAIDRPVSVGNSIKAKLDALDQAGLNDVWKAWHEQWSPAMAKKAWEQGKFSKPALDFLEHMSKVDKEIIGEIQQTQKVFGQKEFTPLENHYMISRTWVGDWRVPIRNDAGELIYVASGKTKKAAEDMAQGIITKADRGWTSDTPMLADRRADSPISLAGYFDEAAFGKADYFQAAKIQESLRKTNSPKFFEKRNNIGGFAAEAAPWTKDELQQTILNHLQQQQRYMAKLTVNEKFASDMHRLLAEDPAMFQALRDRLNDLEGKPGPLAQIQNQIVDKVLSPVLGANSATKIVSTTNQLFMHFNLGALNAGQALTNALQFVQTVIPESAFVLTSDLESLGKAGYYSIWPMAGADGTLRGSVGALDPMKLMWRSFAEMGKPDATLFKHFERGAVDGVISPRLIEEYIGESAVKVGQLRQALKDGQFTGWLRALSESLLVGAEKISRGNAFTAGHIIGRDFLKLQDEQLYQFAKKFTQRTMYGYGTADRARVFTTPLGSGLGLFKNWMMHYMGSMLEYTQQGMVNGNWSPLLWQLAGTTSIGGIAAGGPAMFLADNFSKMATNKSMMDNTYDLFGQAKRDNLLTGKMNPSMSDAVFFGLPSLFGVSLSTMATAPFTDPTKDVSHLFSFVYLDRMNALGKAAGSAIDQWAATGKNPTLDPHVRDQFARALLPKTVYRTVAAWEDRAIKSLQTGNPMYKDVSVAERVAYMTGLNPIYVERTQRVSNELWNDQEKMRNAVTAYGQAFAQAQEAKDYTTMHRIMLTSMRDGIDFSRVLKSASIRTDKAMKDNLQRQFTPQALWNKRNVLGQ